MPHADIAAVLPGRTAELRQMFARYLYRETRAVSHRYADDRQVIRARNPDDSQMEKDRPARLLLIVVDSA
jgi:hypothetical protein